MAGDHQWCLVIGRAVRRLLWACLLCEGLLACIFIPFYDVHMLYRFQVPLLLAAAVGVALFAGPVALSLKAGVSAAEEKTPARTRFPAAWLIIAAGLVLRSLWVAAVSPVQLSDFADYWDLARQLVTAGTYSQVIDGHVLHAFRPPGYSFFLAGWMEFFGGNRWLPALSNLAIYVASSVLIFWLSKQLINRRAAYWALLLFAIWPSGITLTGIAATEPLSLLLLLCATAFMFVPRPLRTYHVVLAGIAAGTGALVRPSYLALPGLWVLYLLISKPLDRKAWSRVALAIAAMAAVLLPWTIRNYRVLGAALPVSSNGGDVFFRANNALATGGWVGRDDLRGYLGNEVLYNHLGYELGKRWIRRHPFGFLKLSAEKQVIFLGDDNTGVYWSLGRGHQQWGPVYQALELGSDLWWLAVWVLAIIGLVRLRRAYFENAHFAIVLACILFFFAVHSVFESQARYHMPMVGFLVMVAACAFLRRRQPPRLTGSPLKIVYPEPALAETIS